MGNSSLPCSSPSEGFEAGISTRNAYFYVHGSSAKESYRDMTTEFFLDDVADEEPQHFLHACALCKKPLASNRDIYMYRGDTPFCSEVCRQEQIEIDEAKECRDRRKFSSSKKASIRDQKNKFSVSSPPGSEEIHVRAGMVVAG